MHNHADWVGLSSWPCLRVPDGYTRNGHSFLSAVVSGALMWIGQPAGAWSEGEPRSCVAAWTQRSVTGRFIARAPGGLDLAQPLWFVRGR
jgi:hypothetical protein